MVVGGRVSQTTLGGIGDRDEGGTRTGRSEVVTGTVLTPM